MAVLAVSQIFVNREIDIVADGMHRPVAHGDVECGAMSAAPGVTLFFSVENHNLILSRRGNRIPQVIVVVTDKCALIVRWIQSGFVLRDIKKALADQVRFASSIADLTHWHMTALEADA